MKKNVAVIGYGGMGGWHCEHLEKSDVASLIGIYDIDEKRMDLARERKIKAYDSLEALLSDENVEIVLIATPNDSHKEIAIKAMNAGKHAICEKPVAMSSEELQEMIDVSNKTDKRFTVHQNRRWDEDFLKVKEVYDNGYLGDVFNIESRVQGSRGIPGDWRKEKIHGGGMVLDWGVHLFDQMLQMVDEKIVSIYSRLDDVTNSEVDDGFKVVFTFESGLTAHIEVGTSNFINLPRWYMQGQNGTALITDWNDAGKYICCENFSESDVIPIKTAAGLTKTMAPRKPETVIEHEMVKLDPDVHDFYRNFCKAVDKKEEQLITHKQMMRVFKLMEACFEAAEKGQILYWDDCKD